MDKLFAVCAAIAVVCLTVTVVLMFVWCVKDLLEDLKK